MKKKKKKKKKKALVKKGGALPVCVQLKVDRNRSMPRPNPASENARIDPTSGREGRRRRAKEKQPGRGRLAPFADSVRGRQRPAGRLGPRISPRTSAAAFCAFCIPHAGSSLDFLQRNWRFIITVSWPRPERGRRTPDRRTDGRTGDGEKRAGQIPVDAPQNPIRAPRPRPYPHHPPLKGGFLPPSFLS